MASVKYGVSVGMSLLVLPSAPGAPPGQSGMGAETSACDEIDSEKTSASVYMACGPWSLRKFTAYSTKKPALKRTRGPDAAVTGVQPLPAAGSASAY